MKIKIKKFIDDPAKSWPERYAALEKHHKEETDYLINLIRDLEKKLEKARYIIIVWSHRLTV